MFKVFVITFAILLIVVIGASVGVLFKRQPIKGSCGGLGALGFEKACDCKEPCDAAKERLAAEQAVKTQGAGKSDTDASVGIYRASENN